MSASFCIRLQGAGRLEGEACATRAGTMSHIMEPEAVAPRAEAQARPPQRLLGKSLFNMAVQALHAVLNLVTFFVLARSLGKQVFGEYALLYALIMVVQLVIEAGTTTLLTCRIA